MAPLVGTGLSRLASLTAQHVTVLASIYFDGQTQEQIAAQLGVQQPRVSKILHEALERLADAGLPPPRQLPRHKLRYYAPEALDRRSGRGF